jgi:hypothetical protein
LLLVITLQLVTLLYIGHIIVPFGRPGSSVGIVTHYGLDGPGIESWWEQDFSPVSRSALGPTQPPVQWVLGLYQG